MSSTVRLCDKCRKPYKRPANDRPGATIRAFCPTCTAANETAWKARKAQP